MHKSKYLPIDQVMKMIKGEFQTIRQYRDYVIENGLIEQGFPKDPHVTYTWQYPGVDTFLGNPEGTYKAWQIKDIKNRKIWKIAASTRREPKKTKPKPVANLHPIISKMSLIEAYRVLLDRNINIANLIEIFADIEHTKEETQELLNLIIEHSKRKDRVKV